MSATGQLLREYATTGCEDSFREIVSSYVNLVFSAALRLVNGNDALAKDITQTVFVDLARTAKTLRSEVMLGGWLHRHTCFVASKALRGEMRRQRREQQAVEMNSIDNNSPADMALVAPILDQAINELRAEDRQAVMLRYFEQLDYQAVGEALGSNEEAARKRVNRALDKLRALLTRRGVSLSTAVIGATLGAHAVQAAPIGLAAAVSISALSAGLTTTTALPTFQLLAMTKIQATALAALVIAAVAIPLTLQHQSKARLEQENAALREKAAQIEVVTAENVRLSNRLASAKSTPAETRDDKQVRELMKLRGEVGVLRKTADDATATVVNAKRSPSPLGDLSQNAEMSPMIRDQQKMGMSTLYQGLAKRANLSPEKMEKLNDTLADHVMTNITHITSLLRDNKTPEEADRVFAQEEQALKQKVKALLGEEGLAQFDEYNRNLASYITAEQFKGMMLKGDKETKDKQAQQLHQILLEESKRALAAAGLPEDYQLVPSLNFRNIASEQQGERSLQLLDDIYAQAAARSGSFLSQEEVAKFGEFRKLAINNNRIALAVNRKMMAPPLK